MATVTWDTIANNRAVLSEDGWQFYRAAFVEGLSGEVTDRLVEAVAALEVVIGMSHPSIPYLYLRSIEPESIGTDKARVQLVYSQVNPREYPSEGEVVIQIGSTLTQDETTYDHTGEALPVVEYTYPDNREQYRELAAETVTQQAKVSKLYPQHTLSIQTRLGYSPGPYAAAFVGVINSGFWKDGAAYTWLCTNIQGISRDGGQTYDCTFEFQYDPNTWVKEYVFVDSITGNPVAPEGDAVCDCAIYLPADFGALPV